MSQDLHPPRDARATAAGPSRRRRFASSIGLATVGLPLLIASTTCSTRRSAGSAGRVTLTGSTVAATTAPRTRNVSASISLPSNTLMAGRREQGVLVVDNRTGRAVSAGCLRIEVQLVSRQRPLERHPTPYCPPANLPAGVTRLPFTLSASATVCEVPNGEMASAADCPSFPPGLYHTEVFPTFGIAQPAPVTVRITPGM